MDNEIVVCICNGISLDRKGNKILPFATRETNMEDIVLSEISQTQKEKSV